MIRAGFLISLAVLLMPLVSCGAAAPESVAAPAPPGIQGAPGLPGNPAASARMQSMEAADEAASSGMAIPAPAAAAPAAVSAPAAPAPPQSQTADIAASQAEESEVERVALVAQNRIIVRTANMSLEVQNVANAIDAISASAQQFGGWVVSSDRSSTHSGFVAVRVPSEQLDQSIRSIRGLSVRVLSEASTSEDVTDRYYDLRARLDGLEATRDRLLELLDNAYEVKDALDVHEEILEIQLEIEAHQGRIKLIEQTAAFSLVNVSLSLAPRMMQVSGGGDRIISVGEPATFRATFYPPPGIEHYEFKWDFGDGSRIVHGTGSVPTADGGRITATINHVYADDIDSPYIVEVKVTGTGDAGIAEGADTFLADVSHIPTISVFANLSRDVTDVQEGREIVYSGTFTRHEDLSGYEFEWDFGDGSPVVSGTPPEDATKIEAAHVFANHRPFPFTVTLKVSANSKVGTKVTGMTSFDVFVREDRGFVIGGWSAVDTIKAAVRALSVVGQALGTALIWVAIFSPVWIVFGLAVFFFVRIKDRRTRNFNQPVTAAGAPARQASAREEFTDAFLQTQEDTPGSSTDEGATTQPEDNTERA